jgi:uncharacterized protein YlzI (FlbEa/FlbD family)
MIKVTLSGSPPAVMWLNPLHLVECLERTDGTCHLRLTNGNSYAVQEGGASINDQMLSWQHRCPQ